MTKHTLKSCGVNTARFLKYVWPFFNIMYKNVHGSFITHFLYVSSKSFLSLKNFHEIFEDTQKVGKTPPVAASEGIIDSLSTQHFSKN